VRVLCTSDELGKGKSWPTSYSEVHSWWMIHQCAKAQLDLIVRGIGNDWAAHTWKSRVQCQTSCAVSSSCLGVVSGVRELEQVCVLCTSDEFGKVKWPTFYSVSDVSSIILQNATTDFAGNGTIQ